MGSSRLADFGHLVAALSHLPFRAGQFCHTKGITLVTRVCCPYKVNAMMALPQGWVSRE
jgi:hypothetical protein